MEWLKNLSNAIEYLERNLDQTISYDAAARIACCSTCYFQRMFSYVAGISLSEYIRRRRMTQAGFALQAANVKVIDVALQFGYTSPTAFNRAFQSVHGISPAAAKIKGSALNAYLPIRLSVQVTGGDAMHYRIENKAAMRIVGIRIPLTSNMEHNQNIVPQFWERAWRGTELPVICGLVDQPPAGLLGVTACKAPNAIDYFIAAATDQPVPPNMFAYEIPAATWVVFECRGPFKESVQRIFKRFLTEWLPFSGYAYAELPDIEVYPYHKGSCDGCTEVWIAIKKEKEN